MAWLIVVAVLFIIGIIPIGVNAKYDEAGAAVRLIAGPVRITVYPAKTKMTEQKKPVKKESSSPKKQNKGGKYEDFIPLLRLVLDLLVDLRYKIRVNNLRFKLILAGDDPCNLAVNYGRAWIALGNLIPQLERVFTIKKRNLEVECDFSADMTTVLFGIDITITIARLLTLGVKHGFRILKEYLRVMNKRKGGSNV